MEQPINIQAVIDDLNEINEKLWEVDIPHPTVPEYKEHHEQIQTLMKFVQTKVEKWESIRN